MKLIGAGLPRTGTLSTQGALVRLGLPCYHMAEVAMREDHARIWRDLLVDDKPVDWRALFADYEATVDAPAAMYYAEILEAFPDAKVLLNLRDGEAWYKSLMTLNSVMADLAAYREGNPRLDTFLSIGAALNQRFLGNYLDRERCIRAFDEHNRRVQEVVPAERLLVFRVQDGWQPLCEFLGCEVPDEPFPHLNEGGDTVRAGLSMAFGIDPA